MTSRDLRHLVWAEALSLLDEAEQMQRRFFRMGQGPSQAAAPAWEPPVDVIETEDVVLVHLALPGVAADSIIVGFEHDAIVVSALRQFPACTPGARIHRIEIPYGRFERRIPLPMSVLELAAKELASGCLTLTFEKRQQR